MKHVTGLTQVKIPITAESGGHCGLLADAIKEALRKLFCGTGNGKCTKKDCGCGE